MIPFSYFYRWAIAGVSLIALFFSCRFALAWGAYLLLSAQTEGVVREWKIFDQGARSAVRAQYHFLVDGRDYTGGYTFAESYWNEGVAVAALSDLVKASKNVFYRPGNPEHSALERIFPLGLLIKSLICWAVLFYFVLLNKKLLRSKSY